ncbi:FadR/GntR family transcriptional regulator [Agromyces sp. LHK192]|uniref:FadR/GntR family transcriptional regulator n=1 Tax=Agromyces sp. LHK192 TaxID=2498704 RepID=UPI000FD72916|nr:FCD domain-containing protein [Agromyces sp. LHK192]
MSSRLHDLVVDTLGARIVGGELAAGDVMMAIDVESELGVSRSVVREAVRVLQSLGMVESVRRVGIRVLPEQSWTVFDPAVIRWRLASERRGAQLRSLTELRIAVEPAAADLAAVHAPGALAAEIAATAERMRAAGRTGDGAAFLELDIRFHALVLEASGNEMFASLADAIGEVLRGRTEHGLMPGRPHEDSMQLHVDVADAVLARDQAAARAAMERIMRRTAGELDAAWSGQPRSAAP